MTVVETILVFAGIPLGVAALVVLGVYGPYLAHQPNRYRPGRSWDYGPAWYLPHPAALPQSGEARLAITGSGAETTAVGGASGEW